MLYKCYLLFHSLYRLLYSVLFVNYFYYKKGLSSEVKAVYKSKNITFDPKYFKRIFYHGMLGSITNEWFTTLRGSPQTKQEATAGFYLGAATAVYDDLFDHQDYTSKETLEDLAHGRYKKDTVSERLSKLFYDRILDNVADASDFKSCMIKVGQFQEESKKQEDPTITEEEVRRITYEKGGYSVALSRSILAHAYPKGEREAVYLLGCLIQLTDDIFDVRRDFLSQTITLPTGTKDIRLIRKEYDQLMEKCFAAFRALPYPEKNQDRFIIQIKLIVSRGLVCFDQLERVQQQHSGIFEISKYTRQELVCDMEKPINIWRSIRYCLQ